MDVDTYSSKLGEPVAAIVSKLRQIILITAPGVYESIKWGHPAYESDGPFAYIRAYPNQVDLGFWRGIDLHDPGGLLEGKGEKIRYLRFTTTAGIDATTISEFVVQAIHLNRVLGDPTKRQRVE